MEKEKWDGNIAKMADLASAEDATMIEVLSLYRDAVETEQIAGAEAAQRLVDASFVNDKTQPLLDLTKEDYTYQERKGTLRGITSTLWNRFNEAWKNAGDVSDEERTRLNDRRVAIEVFDRTFVENA